MDGLFKVLSGCYTVTSQGETCQSAGSSAASLRAGEIHWQRGNLSVQNHKRDIVWRKSVVTGYEKSRLVSTKSRCGNYLLARGGAGVFGRTGEGWGGFGWGLVAVRQTEHCQHPSRVHDAVDTRSECARQRHSHTHMQHRQPLAYQTVDHSSCIPRMAPTIVSLG